MSTESDNSKREGSVLFPLAKVEKVYLSLSTLLIFIASSLLSLSMGICFERDHVGNSFPIEFLK